MSVIESPQVTRTVQAVPSDSVPRPDRSAAPGAVELSDQQVGRLFKLGFVFGTPVLYGVVAVVCMLAAPGHGWLLLAVAWPALFAGWFFGGMVVLMVYELREQRRQRQTMAVRPKAHRRPLAPPRTRPAVAH
jgi:hypothetical protein